MTELQLGLLAIGAVVVAAMLAYNRVQEQRARRDAERAFGSAHKDVLLGAGDARSVAHARTEPPRLRRSPDERIDYVIEVSLKAPALPTQIEEQWQPIQRRHSPRAILAVDTEGLSWKAGLQLVSRDGTVGEAELIEFRAAVETMAAALGATVTAPEMKSAMERARELDQLCAQTDIQVVLHVVAPAGAAIAAERLAEAAQAAGMTLEPDGRYALRAEDGGIVYTLGEGSAEGLTLSLDLPLAPDTRRSFESMARLARQLAASCGGSLADDNGNVLGDAAVAAIALQLDEVRGVLEAQGIAPGGPLATRLFS